MHDKLYLFKHTRSKTGIDRSGRHTQACDSTTSGVREAARRDAARRGSASRRAPPRRSLRATARHHTPPRAATRKSHAKAKRDGNLISARYNDGKHNARKAALSFAEPQSVPMCAQRGAHKGAVQPPLLQPHCSRCQKHQRAVAATPIAKCARKSNHLETECNHENAQECSQSNDARYQMH